MIVIDDIEKIIAQGEGLKIEFKKATKSLPKSFYETVISFSNTDGGTILLGVDDDGTISGIDNDAVSKIQNDIVTSLNSRDCINPPMYVQPIPIKHPLGTILMIQIQASSQVHDYAGAIYIREYETDIDITSNQLKIGDIYLRKRNFFSESQILTHLSITDLDVTLFDKARQLIRNFRSDHPWLLVSDEQMLKDSVLWRKDYSTGIEGFTLAAALIFGKENTIQSILPAYKVEAMVRIENIDRWDDRLTLRKNLIDTYIELKQFINKHLPEKFYMEGDQRIDLRDKIFREVIGNSIVHREYTSAISTDIIISENEVTLSNPNKPLFHGPIDPLGFNPYPKNPNIRKFFTAFGWTDEIGSGIRNTYKYIPLYVHNAKPVFIENDVFKTIIPLQSVNLATYSNEMLSWLELPASISTHLQKGLATIPISASLKNKAWSDVILQLVPSWNEKGTQLTALNWPVNQIHDIEEIKNVSSWNIKGTQLLQKKVWYLISILCLTSEGIRFKDIMESLDYKNEKVFRDNYIKPLRNAGLITLTNQSKPTDPENKYCITEKGRAFLGALLTSI